MASITVRATWDMGHRLPNHKGACSSLHGHTYTADVTIEGPINITQGDSDEGMVQDFAVPKAELRMLIQEYFDHQFLLCERDSLRAALQGLPGVRLVAYVPTAENIASALLFCITGATRVILWETPTSYVEVHK